jgi:hypothetical protein
MTSERRDTLTIWAQALLLLMAGGVILRASLQGPSEHEPGYAVPSVSTDTWTPPPTPEELPDGPQYGPEHDCGDGTRGTYAECWNRARDEYEEHMATWSPSVEPPTYPAVEIR